MTPRPPAGPSDAFACVALIPVYNHPDTLAGVVRALHAQGLPCLLVDDGSDTRTRAAIDALAQDAGADPTLTSRVHIHRLPANRGKGAAVLAGMRVAAGLGYSHALQVDADGQHDTAAAVAFVEAARRAPDALICGYPLYDASVPKGRLYGRYLTHLWVNINTVSMRIRDSMCGFRLYPLQATLRGVQGRRIGLRMDFDPDIVVRLDWGGMPIRNLPVAVRYPLDGLSHFRLGRDNVLISAMHARNFFGMLPRLPKLLWRLLRGRGGAR